VKARGSVLECAGPPALSGDVWPAESSSGLEHSKTLTRGAGTVEPDGTPLGFGEIKV